MDWVVIAEAPNRPIGESWAELLHKNGIPVRFPARMVGELFGGDWLPVTLEVPENRVEEAEDILGPMRP